MSRQVCSAKCHPIVKKLTKRSFELKRCQNTLGCRSCLTGVRNFPFPEALPPPKWGRLKSVCRRPGRETRATKLEEIMDAMSLDHDHRNHHHHHEDQEVAFTQTNLVADSSDTPGATPTTTIDPNLINPWGVAESPTGPFWVSDNGTGVTTIYNGAGMRRFRHQQRRNDGILAVHLRNRERHHIRLEPERGPHKLGHQGR